MDRNSMVNSLVGPRQESTGDRSLGTVGIVGAGVMGRGLTQVFAEAGFQVLLIDLLDRILEDALTEITRNNRLYRVFGRKGASLEDTLGRIVCSTDISILSAADLVIENVTEKPLIKEDVYRKLDRTCNPGCVIAANTSAIPITRIAGWTTRPESVIGMHFMNPAPLKKTVEVIRGYHTSDQTLALGTDLLRQAGQDCIVVNDSPGFVSNRVLMLTINEAIFLLEGGVASVTDIDKIFKNCFGHPMGPLETADLIGLDTILFSLEVLYEMFGDTKYRACPLLRKMVDACQFGRKSGHGFYQH